MVGHSKQTLQTDDGQLDSIATTLAYTVECWAKADFYLIGFAIGLRNLHGEGAHLLDKQTNFARWAEEHVPGFSAANASQYLRAGAVAKLLVHEGRLDLTKPCIAITGLRALSAVRKKYGQALMLEVFDAAKASQRGRKVTERAIKQATAALRPPIERADEFDEYKCDDEPFEKARYRLDRRNEFRLDPEFLDGLDDLRDALNDLAQAPSKDDAIQMIDEIAEVIHELRAILTHVTPVEPLRALPPAA